jgi:hypothetical protein
MPEQPPHPYNLGSAYPVMPMAPVADHCLSVPAGPITFVIEARDLVADRGVAAPDGTFDDFGASLHVVGAEDGVERLRFDCFDKEPHYHYIRPDEQMNIICRLDDIAEGEPISWTIGRLENRLPEMLDYADATGVADAVRRDPAPVAEALATVRSMLEEAQRLTAVRRAGASAS